MRPATLLRYRDGRVRQSRYWDLPSAEPDEEAWHHSPVSAVQEELEESVRLHLRGDVEVALSHSSGLDSHLLRLLINRLNMPGSGGQRCFTYCFPGTPYDEGARVQHLLKGDSRWTHYKTDVALEDVFERPRPK